MSVIRSAILLRRIRDSLIWLFPLIAIGVVFILLMTLSPLFADDFNDVFLQDSKCRICSAREFFANIGWHYFMPSETNDNYHGFLGEEWIDKYYGKGALIFLPRHFLTSALQNPSSFQDFDLSTDLPFYVKSAIPSIPINGIRLCLSPAEPQAVPFYFRPFMDYFERWTVQEVNVDKWRVVSLPQGQTYLFVKKNPLVSDRVSFIDIL